jgi:hypothetical protein
MTPSVEPNKFLRKRGVANQASFLDQTPAYSHRQQCYLDRTAIRNEEYERR